MTRPTTTITGKPVTNQDVRAWARATGRPVGPRGPVPDYLAAEYARQN